MLFLLTSDTRVCLLMLYSPPSPPSQSTSLGLIPRPSSTSECISQSNTCRRPGEFSPLLVFSYDSGSVPSASFWKQPGMNSSGFCLLNNAAIGAAYARSRSVIQYILARGAVLVHFASPANHRCDFLSRGYRAGSECIWRCYPTFLARLTGAN